MKIADAEIKEIVKMLDDPGRSMGTENVFRDWCECSALAFANGCDLLHGPVWERREKRYLDIVGRYESPSIFVEMLARLTNAFEADPWQDHLGRVYMECFGGNKHIGQCFTPINVCRICAGTVWLPKPGERSTLYEPACGGGAMVIAYLRECRKAGYDYQRLLHIYAADLDSLCVHMCFIQLSLLGARATVARQNTITMETFDVFKTPMEMLWPALLCGNPEPQADENGALIAENPWLE